MGHTNRLKVFLREPLRRGFDVSTGPAAFSSEADESLKTRLCCDVGTADSICAGDGNRNEIETGVVIHNKPIAVVPMRRHKYSWLRNGWVGASG